MDLLYRFPDIIHIYLLSPILMANVENIRDERTGRRHCWMSGLGLKLIGLQLAQVSWLRQPAYAILCEQICRKSMETYGSSREGDRSVFGCRWNSDSGNKIFVSLAQEHVCCLVMLTF